VNRIKEALWEVTHSGLAYWLFLVALYAVSEQGWFR
jgi:hypothetical protein